MSNTNTPISTKLKVLHIIDCADIGGISKLVLDLSVAQQQDISLYIGDFFILKNGDFQENFQKNNLKKFSANLTSGFDIRISKYIKAYKIFRQYDILHFHIFHVFTALTAIFSGKSIIYTEHGTFGFLRRWGCKDYINKLFFKKIFLNKFVNTVTCNSLFTEKKAQRMYGLANTNTQVIYNGINIDETYKNTDDSIEPEILTRIKGKFVIGTMSRFVSVKRIDRLIEAFSKFHTEKDTILLLIGDGILRAELEQMVRNHGLSQKVIFTGFRKNISDFQKLLNLCVFPSQHEAFGLVPVEMLLLGKPVVIFSDGGGVTEVISGYSQNDIVDSIDELVERLNYYYKNRNEADPMKQERIKYAKTFDIKNTANNFKSLYLQVLQGELK